MFLSALNQKQKEAFLCLAHDVVVSDGDFTVTEQVMMEEMRREMNLAPTFEAHYLDIWGIEEIFDSRRSRAIALISLIRLSYADGAFEIEEKCFLRDLCRAFKISEEEFSLIDNWVRRLISLEREANGFM
jgi:tellurite resistance protein